MLKEKLVFLKSKWRPAVADTLYEKVLAAENSAQKMCLPRRFKV